jgi:DNA-binding CsgD family transcriptional regulator
MAGILGRAVEIAAIDDFLEGRADGARVLVLEGEPGIGKTTLWRWAAANAESRGISVLRAQPTEAEQGLAFATLGDILAHVHDEIGALPEPQRRALRIALLLEESDGPQLDERVVGTAFANLLGKIAGDRVALVAIDDIQWADPSSWACIRFALRRLDVQVAALLSCRSGFAFDSKFAKLSVGTLPAEAIRELVVQTAHGILGGDEVKRIADLAAGHPLYALEIVRESLARQGEDGEVAPAVRVPPALADAILARVRGLPARTKRELLRLAAGGEGADLSDESLALAVEGGLVERAGDAVRYAHPMFASAVYASATPRERRAVHAELAEGSRDIEDRARHLAAAATGPDERVACGLDDAVTQARKRGATGVAAELATAALRASPPESANLWARLLEAATLQHSVGNLRIARDLLEKAVADAPHGRRRAQILLRLGGVLKDSVHADRALGCFREALDQAEDDAALRAALHANIAYVVQFTVGPAAAEDDARRALRFAEAAGDDALLAQCLAALARIEFGLGRGVQRAPIEHAIELERAGADLRLDPRPSLLLAGQFASAGDLDEAREHLSRALSDLRAFGEPVHAVLHRLSLVEHRAGEWSAAERLAREAFDEARYASERAWQRFGLHALATVQAYRGEADDARVSIEMCSKIAEEIGESTFVVGCRELRGFLALSDGDPHEAERQLAPAHGALREMGIKEPGRFWFLPDEIEALIQLGRVDEAAQWIDWLAARGKALDRAWALATAARCRGLLLEAEGAEEAGPAFEAALREHDRVPIPFDHARTLRAYGAYLRRRRRKAAAREALEEAVAIFERLGAQRWSARARDELAQLGGRARTTGKLTPTERQIADRVASGRSNAEVASELFLSPKTVEWNLSKIYRKLRVRSRAELAAKLAKATSPR